MSSACPRAQTALASSWRLLSTVPFSSAVWSDLDLCHKWLRMDPFNNAILGVTGRRAPLWRCLGQPATASNLVRFTARCLSVAAPRPVGGVRDGPAEPEPSGLRSQEASLPSTGSAGVRESRGDAAVWPPVDSRTIWAWPVRAKAWSSWAGALGRESVTEFLRSVRAGQA